MKSLIFTIVASVGLSLFADAPKFVGYCGNSGEKDRPVVTYPLMERYGGGGVQAMPYYDSIAKRFYMTAGEKAINCYSIDGRLIATYSMPAGMFSWNASNPFVEFEGNIYFHRNGKLYSLPLNAPDGTAVTEVATKFSDKILLIANRFHNGELAILLNNHSLVYWSPSKGIIRETGDIGRLPKYAWGDFYSALDWNENGELFIFSEKGLSKIVDDKILYDGIYPMQAIGIGCCMQQGRWAGDAYYADSMSGRMLRLNKDTLQLDPGDISVQEDNEMGCVGIIHLGDNNYAAGTCSGGIIILQWDEESQKMHRVRRIGSILNASALEVLKGGRIIAGGLEFAWDAPENAPTSRPMRNAGDAFSSCLVDFCSHDKRGEGETYALLMYENGACPAIRTDAKPTSGAGIQCKQIKDGDDWKGQYKFGNMRRRVAGMAVGEKGKKVYLFSKDATCQLYNFNYNYGKMEFEKDFKVEFKNAVTNMTSFSRIDDTKYVCTSEGNLIFLSVSADGFTETSRFAKPFAPEARVSSDKTHIIVTEESKDLVTILNRDGKVLSTLKVSAPGTSSVYDKYLVIHEIKNQRLAKYEF